MNSDDYARRTAYRHSEVGSLRSETPGPLTAHTAVLKDIKSRSIGMTPRPEHYTATLTDTAGQTFTLDTHHLPKDTNLDFLIEGTTLDFQATAAGLVYEINKVTLSPEAEAHRHLREDVHASGIGLVTAHQTAMMFNANDMVAVVSTEGERYTAVAHHIDKPGCDFSQMKPGALVAYHANGTGCIVGISEIHQGLSARVIGHNLLAKTYTLQDTASGKKIILREDANSLSWPLLCRGAQVTYHPNPDAAQEGRFAYVHDIPGPAKAWRITKKLARSPWIIPYLAIETAQAGLDRIRNRLTSSPRGNDYD